MLILDWLSCSVVYMELFVYGMWVGFLFDKDMGNFEVGYNIMGVGWVFL